MNKIIIKSLLNGVLTFILVTLIQYLKGVAIVQTIATPLTTFLAVSAVVGSFIGFTLRGDRAVTT